MNSRNLLFRIAAAAVGIPMTAVVVSSLGSELLPMLKKDGDSAKPSFLSAWKAKTIGNYENRIRAFSHPSKIFSYFASTADPSDPTTWYMNPDDFIRSLVPYRERDIKYSTSSAEKYRHEKSRSAVDFFRLADTDGDGRISFNEYIIFLTLLLIPESHFETAFHAIDKDGNGQLSRSEFVSFMESEIHRINSSAPILQQLGASALRSPATAPSFEKCHGLMHLLFPSKSAGAGHSEPTISKDMFSGFLKRLTFEMRKLEYYRQFSVDECNDTIPMEDLIYACKAYDPLKQEYNENTVGEHITANSIRRATFADFVELDSLAADIEKISNSVRKTVGEPQSTSSRTAILITKENLKSAIMETGRPEREINSLVLDALASSFSENSSKDTNQPRDINFTKLERALQGRKFRGLNAPRGIGFQQWLKSSFVA